MSGSVSSGKESPVRINHILSFPNQRDARELLNRVWYEFEPIIKQRGYRIFSLSELCCCRDSRKRSSKSAQTKVSPSILGYNKSRGHGHEIYLRLRQPENHNQLFPYEDVAGTMAHELAHCVHGPHNVSFYRLMEEILEEHAVAMIQGFRKQQSIQYFSGNGHRLGGTTEPRSIWNPNGPQKLGGVNATQPHIHPREAAATAALNRRLLMDDVWCQPCPNSEQLFHTIIDLTNDEKEVTKEDHPPTPTIPCQKSEIPNDNILFKRNVIRPRKRLRATEANQNSTLNVKATNSNHSTAFTIDLSSESKIAVSERISPTKSTAWQCEQCTFINELDSVICSMCLFEKDDRTTALISRILREEEIKRIQESEREQSIREFGINIYASSTVPTSTLQHLS
jgi:DNA-dependent metalloprotease WSS1